MPAAILHLLRCRRQRQKYICRRRILERPRHYANHPVRAPIQLDVAPHHFGISTEVPLPEAVAQHRFAIPAGLSLIVPEDAAQLGLCP